jgi:hypothetical protein
MKLSLCTLHVFGHVLTPGSPTTLYGYRRGKGTKGEAGEASARAAPLEEQGQPSPISEAALPLFHWLRIDRPARLTATDVRTAATRHSRLAEFLWNWRIYGASLAYARWRDRR